MPKVLVQASLDERERLMLQSPSHSVVSCLELDERSSGTGKATVCERGGSGWTMTSSAS